MTKKWVKHTKAWGLKDRVSQTICKITFESKADAQINRTHEDEVIIRVEIRELKK